MIKIALLALVVLSLWSSQECNRTLGRVEASLSADELIMHRVTAILPGGFLVLVAAVLGWWA